MKKRIGIILGALALVACVLMLQPSNGHSASHKETHTTEGYLVIDGEEVHVDLVWCRECRGFWDAPGCQCDSEVTAY